MPKLPNLEQVKSYFDNRIQEYGASPRGSLALQRLGQARAVLEGRDYVLPDDVKSLVYPALGHRIILNA